MQHHVLGRAERDHFAARIAPFGTEVDEPVAGADHVEVVLDHDQRMPGIEQLTHGEHELGNVVEMQSGCRLIEHKQRAAFGQGLAARRGAAGRRAAPRPASPLGGQRTTRSGEHGGTFRGFGQKAGEFEALRLAARERGHGLAELDVFEADIDDGLQRSDHLAVGSEQSCGFAHGQVQHIGHIQSPAPARDRDFKNLWPVALAIAVRTAKIDIAQKLHLDMLEAGAAARCAASIAVVETEFGRGVAALPGKRRSSKNLADRIPGPDITRGVGARRLADRGLVDKHHLAELLGAQQPIKRARRFSSAAKMAHQGWRQNVLNQRGFARAAHASHAHQALQRKFDIDILEVVVARAFQNQARRVLGHRPLETHTDLLAPAQVGAGERVGAAQVGRAAVKHDLSAALSRPRTHVDHAVGGQHHGWVVLHHHQGVAGVAQALHGHNDAVHVARVQADAGLVEHK